MTIEGFAEADCHSFRGNGAAVFFLVMYILLLRDSIPEMEGSKAGKFAC